jgi:D-serine deaminase-like pyridoxal phosphate-dependent protein
MTRKIWEAVNRDLIGVEGGALRMTTPALMLDLPKLRKNIKIMADQCATAGLGLRPHAKTHKSPQIANEQIAASALGVCCATPHEAIAMARNGVARILLTSPVVQPRHYRDLAALHRDGLALMVVIDELSQVAKWSAAIADAPPLPVLVDIDIGMGRTGVRSPEDAVAIARAVSASKALSYRGVQGYSGMIQHINDYDERRETYGRQLDGLEKVLAALTRSSFAPEIVSGGGTGSFAIDVERRLYTECQVGSYIFMDVEYNEVTLFRDRPNPYLTSLFLRTTVISANTPGQVTINAGFKSLATDGPLAHIMPPSGPGYSYKLYGDEYGRIVLAEGAQRPAIGSIVDLMTPHCDPTVNLHDCYHVFEGDRLVDIWPIVARGVL